METKKSQQRFTEEFKTEAVRQVTERGHSVAEVAARLDVSSHSLYAWIKRLKAELLRVTEARDILKKAAAYFAKLSG